MIDAIFHNPLSASGLRCDTETRTSIFLRIVLVKRKQMTVTQKEIGEEIGKLAAFIDRQVCNTRQIYQRLSPYLDESGRNLTKALNDYKPVLKKQGKRIGILFLKAQLKLVNEMIKNREKKMAQEVGKEGKKKGGS